MFFCTYVLPVMLGEFPQMYPHITLSFTEGGNAALFENLLNLRDEFHASKIYMQLTNSQISIFMQNGHLNYQERSVWHSAGTTEQFEKTNLQIEKTFTILGVIETLVETANEHV